jgi:C1A family cysteine protease
MMSPLTNATKCMSSKLTESTVFFRPASHQVLPSLYTFKPSLSKKQLPEKRLRSNTALHLHLHNGFHSSVEHACMFLSAFSQVRPPALYTFKPSLSKKQLPKKLDWRATPADFAVKDQGQCGSCWVSGRLVTAGWACLVWRWLRHHTCVHITLGRARSYLIRVWSGG